MGLFQCAPVPICPLCPCMLAYCYWFGNNRCQLHMWNYTLFTASCCLCLSWSSKAKSQRYIFLIFLSISLLNIVGVLNNYSQMLKIDCLFQPRVRHLKSLCVRNLSYDCEDVNDLSIYFTLHERVTSPGRVIPILSEVYWTPQTPIYICGWWLEARLVWGMILQLDKIDL